MQQYKALFDGDEETLPLPALSDASIVDLGNNHYHLVRGQRSYRLHVLNFDYYTKTMTIAVDGNRYTFALRDEHDQLIDQMGLKVGNAGAAGDIKSPMPGLILDILVQPGDTVAKGDDLCILEAMKMENVLKAEGEGTIKSIAISKGDAVDKGQLLIEMDPA